MQQVVRSINLTINNILRYRLFTLKSITILSLIVFVLRPDIYYYLNSPYIDQNIESKESKKYSSSFKINQSINQSFKKHILRKNVKNRKDISDVKMNFHKYIVLSSNTLSNILNKYNIKIQDINQIIKSDKDLQNLNSGQKLFWAVSSYGHLQCLKWKISNKEIRIYNRNNNIFSMFKTIKENNCINFLIRGIIFKNFFSSAYSAGMNKKEINEIIKELQWKIDFHKLKKGDEFSILILRKKNQDEKKHNQVVAAHLRSSGKNYFVIRLDDGKFYDHNMKLLKGALRFPTKKRFRVSSNFNPRRLNPITRRIEPHCGVDFAMPQGTPVLAVSDGKVTMATYSNAAGYYVVIQHGQIYTTRYMHLCKLLVKPGQKVTWGDCIALSGNTGRSTGPHLHYEVWINNQAVDPLTAKFPCIKNTISQKCLSYLNCKVKGILTQLQFD